MPTKKNQPPEVVYQQPNNNGNQMTLFLSILALLGTVYTFSRVQSIEENYKKAPPTAQIAPGGNGAQQPEPTPDLTKMPDVTAKDWIRGDMNADVVMVEYSDYECSFCQRFHPTMTQIMQDYKGKVAWVFRQYPLPFHTFAQKSAEAAECVGKIGGNNKFWEFTDKVYVDGAKDRNNLSVENLVKMAGSIGVDSAKVKACVDSGEMAGKVKSDMDGGSNSGVSGTPGTIMIAKNGKRDFVPGAFPVDQVKEKIDALLK